MTVMVVHAVWAAFRRDHLLLMCVLGGLLAGALEPILDCQGLLWFAADNKFVAVQMVGRHIPLYVVLGYAFFFGYQTYIAYRAMLAGRSARFFVALYALSWLLDLALQVTGGQLHLYKYYGNQPFMVFGAPAWWFCIDAGLALLSAAVLFALRDRLAGAGILLVIPLIPALYAGINGAAGWPVFTVLNSNFDAAVNGNGSDLMVWAGGAATIILSLLYAWLCIDRIGKAQRAAGIRPTAHTLAEAHGGKVSQHV